MERRSPSTSTDYSNLVLGIVTAKCILWRQLIARNLLRSLSLVDHGGRSVVIESGKKRLEKEGETFEQKKERGRWRKETWRIKWVDEKCKYPLGEYHTRAAKKLTRKNSFSVSKCRDKEDAMLEVRAKWKMKIDKERREEDEETELFSLSSSLSARNIATSMLHRAWIYFTEFAFQEEIIFFFWLHPSFLFSRHSYFPRVLLCIWPILKYFSFDRLLISVTSCYVLFISLLLFY